MATAGNDAYLGEIQESSDGCSPGDWAYGRVYFCSRKYASRDNISSAVIQYNEEVGRAFVSYRVTTDATRFCASIQIAASQSLLRMVGDLSRLIRSCRTHAMLATRVDLASHDASRKNKLLYFANLDSALQFIVDKGRDASPADLEKKLTEDRHYVTYQTCVDACT